MNSVTIILHTISRVKNFVRIVEEFESDIDVGCGRYVVSAKSIMGLFSLNLLEPLTATIITDDQNEIEVFQNVMEDFKYDGEIYRI